MVPTECSVVNGILGRLAWKPGTLVALISMVAPVCGFRPLRAARFLTENVPKPTKDTWSPLVNASVILSGRRRVRDQQRLGQVGGCCDGSISSVLFTPP